MDKQQALYILGLYSISVMEENIKKAMSVECITESLCCTAEIGTTLQINYTSVKNKIKKRRRSSWSPKVRKQIRDAKAGVDTNITLRKLLHSGHIGKQTNTDILG